MTKCIHPMFKALTYEEKLKIYENAKECFIKSKYNGNNSMVFHHSVLCAVLQLI